MSQTQRKWHVVWRGRKPGVYDNWDAAKAQVDGFPGARYRAFLSEEAAQRAFASGRAYPPELRDALAVDAACDMVGSRRMEYRCARVGDGATIFHGGPFEDATNNVGEFLGIVEALQHCARHHLAAPVFTDSAVALGWVAQGKCRTNLAPSARNAPLFARIAAAEQWLAEHPQHNPVQQWDTARWGENPADFGRK